MAEKRIRYRKVWAEVVRCVHARVQAYGAVHPVVASVTELIVGLRKRESNQPRSGVAPGCPQHKAEGSTLCLRG